MISIAKMQPKTVANAFVHVVLYCFETQKGGKLPENKILCKRREKWLDAGKLKNEWPIASGQNSFFEQKQV